MGLSVQQFVEFVLPHTTRNPPTCARQMASRKRSRAQIQRADHRQNILIDYPCKTRNQLTRWPMAT
jgi:hypothetical protein